MSYYLLGKGKKPKGPYSESQLRQLWAAGKIPSGVLCCKKGMNRWQPIEQFGNITSGSASARPANIAPVLTNQPCVSHEISDNHIKKFMAMLPPGCRPIVSCKLFRDSSWLIIMIPLWFNLIWTYLIITDKCLAICTRTLWVGCKEVVYFEYDSIEAIVFVEEIKTFGNDYSVVINIFGAEEPIAIVTDKSAHQFLARNLPRIQRLHSNSLVLTN